VRHKIFVSRKKLNRLVCPLIKKETTFVFGDRAFAFDLNGDKVNEYFVPLECAGMGFNCQWGIFTVSPARLIGSVWGEYVYVHERVGRWSQLTVDRQWTVSDSEISTYRYSNGRYRQFGKPYDVSAYRKDFPKSLLTVSPTCDPGERPRNARQ
jgi:hypothetical protein